MVQTGGSPPDPLQPRATSISQVYVKNAQSGRVRGESQLVSKICNVLCGLPKIGFVSPKSLDDLHIT